MIHRNKREGWWHGVVPYGYRRPTANEAAAIGRRAGVIVPDDETAPHVRELFRRYLAGDSLYSLGILGVERGWFSRDGTAKDILNNAAYAGMITMAETRVLRYTRGGAGQDRLRVPSRPRNRPQREPVSSTDGRHRRAP